MRLNDHFAQLTQLSYVAKNLDAAVDYAGRELGITNFSVSEPVTEVLADGRPQVLAIRAAIANIGTHQFEIIQPISGPIHVYTDDIDLDRQVMTFHHIAIAVRGDYARWAALRGEIERGDDPVAFLFPVVPDPGDKVAFAYVDTRKRLGHHTEYLWWDKTLNGFPSFPQMP